MQGEGDAFNVTLIGLTAFHLADESSSNQGVWIAIFKPNGWKVKLAIIWKMQIGSSRNFVNMGCCQTVFVGIDQRQESFTIKRYGNAKYYGGAVGAQWSGGVGGGVPFSLDEGCGKGLGYTAHHQKFSVSKWPIFDVYQAQCYKIRMSTLEGPKTCISIGNLLESDDILRRGNRTTLDRVILEWQCLRFCNRVANLTSQACI